MNGEKTNSKWFFYLVLLIAVILAWYPYIQNQRHSVSPDPVDSAFRSNPNSRTWEVYQSGGHLNDWDKFRIMKVGNEYRLKPSNDLRDQWGKRDEPAFYIKLTKLEVPGDADTESMFCGMFNLTTIEHSADQTPEKHAVLIQWDRDTDILQADFFAPDSTSQDCKSVWENRERLREHHGGTAHSEN